MAAISIIRRIVVTSFIAGFAWSAQAGKIDKILSAEHRSEINQARDEFRHPEKTLKFFEIKENMSVIEIWPGAGGWYTEILAPYLKKKGTLYLADFESTNTAKYFINSRKKLRKKLDDKPEIYGAVELVEFSPSNDEPIVTPNSVDRVLTFRNAHNWYMRGGGEEKLLVAFKKFYAALKPGGMLGIVDHRLPESRKDHLQEHSGYIKQSLIIATAKKAGFQLKATSEVNANPKDTTDHPKGVWTLPPSLRLGDDKKAYYLTIGESDRMTLKFIKPKK